MSHDSKFAINHFLKSNGFAGLEQAGSLMTQLAYLIRDHGHFRSMLNSCEPAERRHMYDALAPNLSFQAKPLDVYMSELAQAAEREQLPTLGEDGHFKPFKTPELVSQADTQEKTDGAIATAAVAEAIARERLWVVCTVCTREDVFRGVTKQDAVEDARKAGWRHARKHSPDSEDSEAVEVCPACVKARAPRMVGA